MKRISQLKVITVLPVGFPLLQSGVWQGKNGTCEFMYFDTQGAINTCFESYVFSDDWEDPEDTEYFPSRVDSLRRA